MKFFELELATTADAERCGESVIVLQFVKLKVKLASLIN